jgi:uncharacterized membrane protein YheB (UPF0754 family)
LDRYQNVFHPKLPTKILGITFHGIFPKRQKQFAEKLGKLVSQELLSFSDIEKRLLIRRISKN